MIRGSMGGGGLAPNQWIIDVRGGAAWMKIVCSTEPQLTLAHQPMLGLYSITSGSARKIPTDFVF